VPSEVKLSGFQYELMTRVATMYYMEELTQQEIAEHINISRIKVGRLLKKAREEGIVEIRVRPHPSLNMGRELELVKRFGLRRSLIAIDQPDPDDQRGSVARLVARYLSDHLEDGMVIAVGMGRNCGAVPDYAFKPVRRECTFVSAMGGSPKAKEPFNPDHICRRLAERFGGQSESLYAPAYVQTKKMRGMFINQEDVRDTLQRARRADLAIVGIGDIGLESNVVNMGCVSPKEMLELSLSGSVGDILGCDFDIEGNISDSGMKNRVVGISVADLKNIPEVIAVASEKNKTLSILGALRLGVIDVIATGEQSAKILLSLDTENPRTTKSPSVGMPDSPTKMCSGVEDRSE